MHLKWQWRGAHIYPHVCVCVAVACLQLVGNTSKVYSASKCPKVDGADMFAFIITFYTHTYTYIHMHIWYSAPCNTCNAAAVCPWELLYSISILVRLTLHPRCCIFCKVTLHAATYTYTRMYNFILYCLLLCLHNKVIFRTFIYLPVSGVQLFCCLSGE